ncbi:MAG: hypothetical protein HY000_00930, partial [Planctomycetes bacterium]|nr:hypothetical protein [Planctomycetota bacterium]
MNQRTILILLMGLVLALVTTDWASAQVSTQWVIPKNPQKVDLTSQNPERRLVFLDDGLAIQVPLNFVLIRHRQVSIVADLPEPGRFDVKLKNARALVEVEKVRVEGQGGRAEVVAKVAPKSTDEVVQQAKAELENLLGPGLALARDEVPKKGN